MAGQAAAAAMRRSWRSICRSELMSLGVALVVVVP